MNIVDELSAAAPPWDEELIVDLLRDAAYTLTTINTRIRELHRARKFWEDDRTYYLLCRTCELQQWPCKTIRELDTFMDGSRLTS